MSSADLVAALIALPDTDWREFKGGFLTQSTLSRLLRPFDVRSKTIRTARGTCKGYVVAGDGGLGEAWERHLRPHDEECATPTDSEPETPVTSVTAHVAVGEHAKVGVPPSGTVTPSVALTVAGNMLSSTSVTAVAAVTAPGDAEKLSPAQKLLEEQYPLEAGTA